MRPIFLSIMIALLPAIALCEEQAPEAIVLDGEEAKTKVIFKKSESHKFSGLKLKGQLKKPDLSYIYQRKGLRAEQIVNIPEDFNEEIIQGAGQF